MWVNQVKKIKIVLTIGNWQVQVKFCLTILLLTFVRMLFSCSKIISLIFNYIAWSGSEPDRSILHEYIKKEIINGKSVSVCTMCGKSNSQKWNIINHVESVHFPNMFTYSCKYCGKTYNAKNSLYVHMSTSHRENKTVY